MQINLPDSVDIQAQAFAAGFANVDQYVINLIERDKDRAAIQEGLEAMRTGRVRPFADFDAQFRQEKGL
jgi:hypothetical protein